MAEPPSCREQDLADKLDRPMSLLGLLFLLVVLAEPLARGPALSTVLVVTGWALWGVFLAEFLARWWLAPDRLRFLRRNWWQAVLLAVPFLRFVRLLKALRVASVGRVVSSAVRGSRSAGRLLSSRLGWLAAVTAVVVFVASHLLYLTGAVTPYGDALHRSALATISGEPIGADSAWAKAMEVMLAAYSVIIFATLAASLGAYFLDHRNRPAAEENSTDPADQH